MNNQTDYKFEKDTNRPIWCPGCGLYILYRAVINAFKIMGWTNKDVVVVSGIGCSGRFAGYLNLDSLHTTHGRAIAVAEGIKLANPKLNVVVVSGDGDLLGIGGNHLIHTARRNTDITVICNANRIYGMTGGQASPITPKGIPTLTTPNGNEYNPINAQKLISSNDSYFFARTSVHDAKHVTDTIVKAIKWKGFSFVEVASPCITNYGRRLGYKHAGEMLMEYKKYFTYQDKPNKLKPNQLGIISKEPEHE